MLTRFLPGSVALVAAFTMPELSVGAGDLAGSGGFDDPPEPASKLGPATGLGLVKPGQTPVKPQLAGVRYAPIIELDLSQAAPAAVPAGNRPELEAVAVASAPLNAADTPAFVPTPPQIVPSVTPVTGGAGERADAFVPASMPIVPVVAAVVVDDAPPVTAPAALPAVQEAPSLPREDRALAVAPPAPVTPPAPMALPAAAAGGMIEQVTPARIAAVQTPKPSAVSPAMGAPAARPPAAAAPVAAASAVAAPAARAPVSVAVAPPPLPARPAASAPVPDKTAAIVVPRPANPALAAPAASTPVPPAITARLITRVDGKTAGAVDFQQTPGGLKVRLGSIVEVLADRYDAAQLARIRASAAGSQYLSLAQLQAQGVPISYDPVYDEFNVGLTDTRPKAARKVHMDQISTPERGLGATGMEQVPR